MGIPRRRTGHLLLIAALLAPAKAQAAFECPVTAPPATRPLPGDLNQVIKPSDDPRDDRALKADIGRMVSENMPRGEIVDHVVAAYCPTVSGLPGLSDGQKDALVQRFASHLAQTVYAPARSTVDDVILDVPVPPDLYTRVRQAADQHQMSQDAFVLQALRRAAGTP